MFALTENKLHERFVSLFYFSSLSFLSLPVSFIKKIKHSVRESENHFKVEFSVFTTILEFINKQKIFISLRVKLFTLYKYSHTKERFFETVTDKQIIMYYVLILFLSCSAMTVIDR